MKQPLLLSVLVMALAGTVNAAYEFSDEAVGISITLPADWECTTDIVKEGTGAFEFSGMGLDVVLQYDVDKNWGNSQQRLTHILEKARAMMDNMEVLSTDSLQLWGLPAAQATYKAEFKGSHRIARVVSVVAEPVSLSVIFVKQDSESFTDKDLKAMGVFLDGVKLQPHQDK